LDGVFWEATPVVDIETKHRGYMAREPIPDRRHVWRQKVSITDSRSGHHTFYVDFGEYPDGRLAEVFITAQKCGTFVRGVMDSLARSVSLALQSGTSPLDMALQLLGQNYPPQGTVDAVGSSVTECLSIADYIGQEIQACYGADGRRLGGCCDN
jgi:ribonucleoside-diphosphate reductase alpha chain